MRRPSEYLARLEDRLAEKLGPWFDRHKAKFPIYIPLGSVGWYFYGMFLSSLRLGTAATFHTTGEEVESIWVFDPLRNWFVVLTPFGLGVTAVIVLLICLITKKGYIWFSGYKYIHDPRGFDILPDATHGSSGFLTKKEMAEFLELGGAAEVKGMLLGKYKKRPGGELFGHGPLGRLELPVLPGQGDPTGPDGGQHHHPEPLRPQGGGRLLEPGGAESAHGPHPLCLQLKR